MACQVVLTEAQFVRLAGAVGARGYSPQLCCGCCGGLYCSATLLLLVVPGLVTDFCLDACRLLGWSDYLLPSPEPQEPNAAAAPAAGDQPQQQQQAADAEQQRAADAVQTADGVNGFKATEIVAAAPPAGNTLAPLAAIEASEAGPSSSAAAAAGPSAAVGHTSKQHSIAPDLQSEAVASIGQQQHQQQQQQQQQHEGGTAGGDSWWSAVLQSLFPSLLQQQQQHRPVQWYEQQPSYTTKLLLLGLSWLASMVLLNCVMLIVPIGVGRAVFQALHLPWKNDLFTGTIGLLALWGAYSLAAGVATSANVRNLKAVLAATWRWLVLAVQCTVLLVLWLGVVATMLGMLCELVLLPLRLPPNQTALIYLYQVRHCFCWCAWPIAACWPLTVSVSAGLLHAGLAPPCLLAVLVVCSAMDCTICYLSSTMPC